MTTLRFSTLNVRDLQVAEQPTHPNVRPWNRGEYEQKVAWLSAMVRRLDADVLAFQEVWTPRALYDVFAGAGREDDHVLVTTPGLDRVGQRTSVALAVRRPWVVRDAIWVTALPGGGVLRKRPSPPPRADEEMSVVVPRFARPLLRVVLERDGVPPVTVFAVHLKSRRPTELDPEDLVVPDLALHATALGRALAAARRAVEAVALRALVEQEARGDRAVVLMGDLNGPVGGETLGGDVPRGRALGLNVAASLADPGGEGPFTYVNQGVPMVLDHVLVSDAFLARPFRFLSYDVANDHLVLPEGVSLPRHVSDHAGVAATFAVED